MPQPALHLLLGRQQLARWAASGGSPFHLDDVTAVNAFLHGTLAPDMGNFPGGSRALARAVHTVRTADVTRALLAAAATPSETAFAWGWLSHVLADAAIHPLVNAAAVRRSPARVLTLPGHVRVEVGIDVRFCCDDPLLEELRLAPAFDRAGYRFLADVLRDVLRVTVSAAQLVRMERGLVLFSHAALRFARGAARRLCWQHDGPRPPLADAMVWHAATRIGPAGSVVRAYLTPHVPDEALVAEVGAAIDHVHAQFQHWACAGLDDLPSYNLQDGTLTECVRHVA